MITPTGVYSFADYRPGPPERVYPGVNTMEFVVGHSLEGNGDGAGVLTDPSRQASWCGTIMKVGALRQFYPVTGCCWASGNREINIRGVAFEMEGRAGEPATEAQRVTARRCIRELGEFSGRNYQWANPARPLTSPLGPLPAGIGNIVEHNRVATWVIPNAGPTACPSGRWDFLIDQPEEDMASADFTALNAALQDRMALQRLANDPDILKVKRALELLRAGGITP